MNEDDVQQHRRDRLKAWLDSNGGLAKVAERRRLKPSYQSYLSQITNGYSIGARGARTCEQRLGMPSGWLDEQAGTKGGVLNAAFPAAASADDLSSAVATVARALQQMHAERRGELVKVFGMLADYPDESDYRERLAKLLTAGAVVTSAKRRKAA